MRAIALFFALVFLAYTVISDYQQRRASFERYKAIAQYTEESRAAIENANRQQQTFEQSLKNTTALLQYMDQMTESMRQITDILRVQAEDHKALIEAERRRLTPPPAVKTKRQRRDKVRTDCWQLVPQVKQFGRNANVTEQKFERVPCHE